MHRILFTLSCCLLWFGCKNSEPFSCDLNPLTIDIASLTQPSSCDAQDASVVFTVSGGLEPYNYTLNTGSTFITSTSGSFDNLFPGYLSVIVRDKNKCSSVLEFELLNELPSGTSYINDIAPILNAHCNLSGCHNGDLGGNRDWTKISAIQAKLNNFQRVLSLDKMPPAPNPKLAASDVSKILCWISDGGLNN